MLTQTRNLAAEMKDTELYIVDLGIEIGKIQSRFFCTPSPFLRSLSQKSVKRVTPHPYKK
jgi:hypothetical protein